MAERSSNNRIIVSVTNDLTNDQRVHRIALSLSNAGYSVLVVGRRYGDSPPVGERPYATRRMKLLFRKGKLFYLEYMLRLLFFLLMRKAALYYANDLDTLGPNVMAGKLKRIPVVYDSHEYFTEVPELQGRARTRAMWLRLERWAFPKVSAAMTVNDAIAERYHKLYQVKVISVRNLPLRNPRPKEATREAGRLIYQGALNVGRGIELMIDAMAHLPGCKLWIAGKGDVEADLRNQVEKAGLEDQVEFLGLVPFRDLPGYTRKAVLGMSLEEALGESYKLALPNKLFDYIQSEVPVLVSDLEVMEATVRTHEVGKVLRECERTPAMLARKIREMLEDQQHWEELVLNCGTAAGALCWEKEQEKLLQVVESLLKQEARTDSKTV